MLSLTSLFTNPVTADVTLLCDQCTSTEIRQKAISHGGGPVHVIDPVNGIIKKYYVSFEQGFGGNELVLAAPMIPDSYKAMLVKEAYDALTLAKGVIVTHPITVPHHIANSAWELTGRRARLNAVINFLNQSTTFGRQMTLFGNNVLSMVPAFPEVPITVRVSFEDLSYVDLKLGDRIDTGHYEYEAVRAREFGSYGNDIPLEEEGLVGNLFEFVDADDNPNLETFMATGTSDRVFIRIPPGIPSNTAGSGWIAIVTHCKANGVTTCTTRRIQKKLLSVLLPEYN